MGRVYLCLGKNAEVPYYFERARIHVWNVEELCYFVRENAWVLEPSILNRELVRWVEEQCALADLARQLGQAVQGPHPVMDFVRTLFSYTGYCSGKDIQQVEKILNINENSSEVERSKARGDYFLQAGKYVAALREYEELTEGLTGMDPAFLGKVYHNCGVARAKLFLFSEAAACFEQAWKLGHDPASARQYLMAMRFSLGEKEYVNFLAERPTWYAASLKLEEAFQQCDADWETSEQQAFLERVGEAARSGAAHIGRQMVREQAEKLQEAYRAYVDA